MSIENVAVVFLIGIMVFLFKLLIQRCLITVFNVRERGQKLTLVTSWVFTHTEPIQQKGSF